MQGPPTGAAAVEAVDAESTTRAPPPSIVIGASDHVPPSLPSRLFAVWVRHWRVYASTLLANALPAFAEPVLFLAAIGLGLGNYIERPIGGQGGLPLGAFMGPGVLAMTAMFTATYETTFGTFVRLVYQKTYDAMLCTPLRAADCFLGEMLWCGTKGAAFTAIVAIVYVVFGAANGWIDSVTLGIFATPIVGFITGTLFGALGVLVTSRVKNLNNFAFYFTGLLTPMTFFSGMVFPVSDLPAPLSWLAYALPLFHVTETQRLLLFGPEWCVDFVWVCPIYLVVVTPLLVYFSVRAMTNRVRG